MRVRVLHFEAAGDEGQEEGAVSGVSFLSLGSDSSLLFVIEFNGKS